MIRQRKDRNEREIIEALRAAGCFVLQMDRRAGFDLLVVRNDDTWIIEVKMPGELLTDNEAKTRGFIAAKGGKYFIIYGIDGALDLVNG